MFDRKAAKRRAKTNVKKHYVIFVIACLLAFFLGAAYTSSLSVFEQKEVGTQSSGMDNRLTADDVLNKLIEGNLFEASKTADDLNQIEEEKGVKIGALELGRRKGILSGVVNKISSGQFLIIVFETIDSVIKSEEITTSIFIVLAGLAVLFVTIFVKDTYKIAYRRIFLEGYLYEEVKISRFLFVFRVKKYIKASWAIFVTSVYQLLWDLTIVGGIIKRFSYYMVPYIIAENPDLTPRQAIGLSRRMMYGHKWECFKLELSFIGWDILGLFTLGLSEILYSNPYKEATIINYFVYLRSEAKANGASFSNRLIDKYLYEKADIELIEKTYADIIDIMTDDIDYRDLQHKGARGFIENNLGIIYKYDEQEDAYNVAIEQEERIEEYKNILDLRQYPGRLFPIKNDKKNTRLEHVHYLRHYSIWSIIAMFFIFCFIGWSWEVALHLVEDGVFVNRGVNHGPWLPIYGTGGIMILVVLFKYRNRPGLEALLTILLCGVVEYSTHWFLEITKGTKWWDYTGYFLNLNGRICAEGLLVFMLGGIAIVYAGAPSMDNMLRKVNKKVLRVICIVLLVIFAIDVAYSSKHPNTGEGITDYDDTAYVVSERLKN